MKRVLVTGASGFLGRHCIAALAARGWADIHAVSRNGNALENASSHACDLLDPFATKKLLQEIKASHALHLAWYTVPGAYWTSPENLRWVAASATLFEEFARAGGRRFVAAGTCAEYAWSHGICSEATTPLKPWTPYGAAKHALQMRLSSLGPALGVATAWGRVFFPYGPREHPERLVAYVIRSLLAGEPALCTSGEQRRDFIYAGDAADAFAALLESGLTGAVNIGSGAAPELRSIIAAAAKRVGRPELIRLGARPLAASEPPLLCADVTRLRDELHWRARTSLEQGIAACVEYWQHA